MEIARRQDFASQTSFGFPVEAAGFFVLENLDDLFVLMNGSERAEREHKFVLGAGTNLLFADDVPALVLQNCLRGKEILEETVDEARVRVGAGEDRDEFVDRAVARGLAGIENLAGIPGTVGAAPVQNIGAYGAEISSVVEKVFAVELAMGVERQFSVEECEFGYRRSVFNQDFRGKFLITAVLFKFRKWGRNAVLNLKYPSLQEWLARQSVNQERLEPVDVATIVRRVRASKLPNWREIGTAGSFFKNPFVDFAEYERLKEIDPEIKGFLEGSKVKLSAGQLIEKVGMKGERRGAVGVSDRHALVLVHHGGGKAKDLLGLAREIVQKVQEKFGVKLEPEVTILGGGI